MWQKMTGLEEGSYERRLQVVIENAHHAIVVVDRQGLVQLANPAVTRLTGFDHRALIGQKLEWIIPERHREAHAGYVADYLAGAHSEILTRGRVIQIQHVDGRQVPVFIRIHETKADADHFFTAILEDLSTETMLKDRLEEGAAMLRAMAESNPSGIFISDASAARNVFVNDELCRIYEATEAELLLPGAWLHFIHPEDGALVQEAMQRALAEQASAQVVHRVVTRNGKIRWVHVGARPLVKNGQFQGFIGSVVDITPYKNAELEMAAERARLYEITRMLPASVKYFDADGRYIFVNAAVEKNWKKSAEEFRGRHYSEMLPQSMLQIVQPYMARAFAGEEVRFNITLPSEAGSRHLETTYLPHKRDGRVIGMTASAIDVTEIREKNNRLEVYEQMIEGMSEGVVLASLSLPEEISYVNPAMERMLGQTASQIRGQQLLRFAETPDHPESFAARVRSELRERGTFRAELVLAGALGRRIDAAVKASLIQMAEGPGILYILTDVSSIKEAERLAQAERDRATLATAAKSRFIAHVSHEIRNPLNAMLGYTELLLDHKQEVPAAVREMLSHIQGAGRGLLRLVGEVLDLEQIEAGQMSLRPETFSLKGLLSELASTMHYRALLHSLAFDMQVSDDVPEFIELDRMRLYQILLNLTSNAAKYSPRGGCVRLEVGLQDGRLHIHVVDDGPGISPEFEGRLFTPFARAASIDESVKGTGLGLFISRQLAHLMGGSLEYERRPEGGSIFCLCLPLVPAAAPAEDATKLHEIPRFEGVKVLVVDDSDLNRTVLCAILEQAGCEVWSASTGALALEICDEIHPDICFVDYHMPGMSGASTIEKLRRVPRLRDVKAVLLSGDIFEREVQSAALADHYLLKPYERKDIYRILRELIQK